MTKATIKVVSVVGFCCTGYVKVGRKTVHETRDYPYGFNSNAYNAAEQWAKDNGYSVKP